MTSILINIMQLTLRQHFHSTESYPYSIRTYWVARHRKQASHSFHVVFGIANGCLYRVCEPWPNCWRTTANSPSSCTYSTPSRRAGVHLNNGKSLPCSSLFSSRPLADFICVCVCGCCWLFVIIEAAQICHEECMNFHVQWEPTDAGSFRIRRQSDVCKWIRNIIEIVKKKFAITFHC